MKRLAILLGAALALVQPVREPVWAQAPSVRIVEFESMVNPVSILRITQAIDDAEAQGDDLVLIRLDTPGGLVDSMERAVKRMLAAKVPIVVWVGPSGAKAASAGFFLLIAADVAAMAPGTRTGAASTVMLGGDNQEGDVLLKKANEDMAAMIRSIAEHRGRNIEACEKAVFEAKAYEEQVALANGLIDLVAKDRTELMEKLDGRKIQRFDGSTLALETRDATFVESEFPWRRKFMEALAHPVVAYLLFLGGIVGIYVEFTHPGVVLPGLVGALCLLLFTLAAQALPVSAVGVLLVLLSFVMFVLEIKVVSYGMLTVGGVLCMLLGSWMLVDGPIPEMRVPFAIFVPTSVLLSALSVWVVFLAVQAQRGRVQTGMEGLTQEIGTVTRALEPEGSVFIHGELWNAAAASDPIPAGARIRVVKIDGMRLIVEPVPERRAVQRS